MRVLKRKQKGWKTALKILFANRSNLCVHRMHVNCINFQNGLYLYYFVRSLRNLFIFIYIIQIRYYYFSLSLFLSFFLVLTMQLEYVIELKGFCVVHIICIYVRVVLWPPSLPVIICHTAAGWPDFDGKK